MGKNRLVEMLLLVAIMALAGCGFLAEANVGGLEFGERVDLQPMGYISVDAGAVYDCISADCIVLAQFGAGQPLTVIGMIGGEFELWYVVWMGDGEGFVPARWLQYDYRLNTTPTPINEPNKV